MKVIKQDILILERILEKIEHKSKEILKMLHDIRPISGFKYLEFESIDSSYIYFEGDEYWRYGGHEKYMYDMPINFLYDNTALNEEIEKLKELNKRDEEKKELKEQIQRDIKRKQYEQLKKEFGD